MFLWDGALLCVSGMASGMARDSSLLYESAWRGKPARMRVWKPARALALRWNKRYFGGSGPRCPFDGHRGFRTRAMVIVAFIVVTSFRLVYIYYTTFLGKVRLK